MPEVSRLSDSGLRGAMRRLEPFLELHPDASIERRRSRGASGPELYVTRPWGEDGILLSLPKKMDVVVDALNNICLPDRYSAIWHRDSQDFEIIWTAFPLSQEANDLANRTFSFSLDSNEHQCEFGRSSERLLVLAEHAMLTGASDTQHRNLLSFRSFVRQRSTKKRSSPREAVIGEPYSFWIRNLEWEEDYVLRLVRHLNFFLRYYDRSSPTILIHAPTIRDSITLERYLIGDFPAKIETTEIEDDLLQLWEAGRTGDAARKFLYFYRIVEYASHAYIDVEARKKVRRLLAEPHARSDLDHLTDNVVSAALTKTMDDIQKMNNLLRNTVSTDLLWREMSQHGSAFNSDVCFDGGFLLRKLVNEGATHDTFEANGLSQFISHARSIRNHLSHGRDKSTQTVILPTVANFRRLEPWTAAISVVAGEVLAFGQPSPLR